MASASMASPFLLHLRESIPTGTRQMGGIPRGKEFAPEETEVCCKLHAQVFRIARLPDKPGDSL